MKIIKLLVCYSLLLLLSGCTGILWAENKVVDSKTEVQVRIKDNITDVLQYHNLAVSAFQQQQKIPLDIPPKGIAFLGEKNIYILTEGAPQLLELDNLSVRLPLATGLHGGKGPIRMQLESNKKGNGLVRFRNILLVRVAKRDADFSAEELKLMAQVGFESVKGEYSKRVQVSGVIISREKLNYTFSQKSSLNKERQIEFFSIEKTAQFHPVNLVTNIVFTPLAVAADIVFFPVSLGVLEFINNANSR